MRVEEVQVQGTYEVCIGVMLLRPYLRTLGTTIDGVSANGISVGKNVTVNRIILGQP